VWHVQVQEHAAIVEKLKAKYETSISAEQDTAGTLDDKKRTYQEDYDKSANDIEGDVDAEMEDLRARYERKLQAESKATLLLQGENGFWKHKFVKANREMQDKKDEMNGLADKEKELHEAIAALQKDVQGHKKEIRERDETIADKEGRIYDLKKKNQVRNAPSCV
jgi:predicted  nucleic acid-binding Zn-ribbon protein